MSLAPPEDDVLRSPVLIDQDGWAGINCQLTISSVRNNEHSGMHFFCGLVTACSRHWKVYMYNLRLEYKTWNGLGVTRNRLDLKLMALINDDKRAPASCDNPCKMMMILKDLPYFVSSVLFEKIIGLPII